MDQGIHDFRLLVAVGSPSQIKHAITAYADFLSMPPVAYPHLPLGSAVYEGAASAAQNNDFLTISDRNLRLLALYKQPRGEAILHQIAGIDRKGDERRRRDQSTAREDGGFIQAL